MQNNVSDKNDLQFYRQCPVIAQASDFPRTFPNMSKRSFSLTLIGAYFSLSEIRKIPSLSFCNFLIYVDVLAEFSKDGLLIPKEITWEDGRKYEITRVKDKRRAASTRAGGVGERYTCVVDGKEIFLFYEDNNMWFMERAGA